MTQHFNGLTPAEAERLAMLAEEAAEVIQVVGKILRHGYESHHPDNPRLTNRALLENEVADFEAVMTMMENEQDISVSGTDAVEEAMIRKTRYTHHQEG